MTQDELEILDRARSHLEKLAIIENTRDRTQSSLLGSELTRLAYSLEDIVNKYRGSDDNTVEK